MAGVDPSDRTLRELIWMADGRRRDEWDRVSLLATLLFNQWRKRADCKRPHDFHPYLSRQKRRGLTPATIGRLKALLPREQREA